MTIPRLARWGLFIGFLLGVSEVAVRLALPLVGDPLALELRPTQAIYREQTARIHQLLGRNQGLLVLDPILGWRYRTGHRDANDVINCQGVRSATEYPVPPGGGVFRVAAFGDSFVYSNEVNNADSWAGQIEQRFPGIEVLNYGVGGYGVDQAYLRYLGEGRTLSPQLVLIGFVPDDITRVVNVYRRFRSNQEIPLVKPRFVLDPAGTLTLLPSPIKDSADYRPIVENPEQVTSLGKFDYWYDPAVYQNPLYDRSVLVRLLTQISVRVGRRIGPHRLLRDGIYNPQSEAFRIQMALFQEFADSVRASGARPIILLFPGRSEVQRRIAGESSILSSLKEALTDQNLEFLDLLEAFGPPNDPAEIEAWFMPGGHYSPAGNRLVADWLGHKLTALSGLTKPLTISPEASRLSSTDCAAPRLDPEKIGRE